MSPVQSGKGKCGALLASLWEGSRSPVPETSSLRKPQPCVFHPLCASDQGLGLPERESCSGNPSWCRAAFACTEEQRQVRVSS